MPTTITQTQTSPSTKRGGKQGGQRGRNGHRGGGNKSRGRKDAAVAGEPLPDQPTTGGVAPVPEIAEDPVVCWICAEPVKYYSVSACNHRTCHVCALRLRALYKKLDCTFCKEPQPTVIFTTSPDTLFSSYTPDMIPHKDPKLMIHFETADMMEETLILLRFNCPDSQCDYTANGWSDLKLHVRSHGKMMCDLCVRVKKIFSHEHALYPPNILPLHLPSMSRSHKQVTKEPIEGGIHPLCAFCRECFFSDDELYVHMRERHEECFICKRNEIRDQYFQNYEALERHFTQAHFVCLKPACLAQKFVVFGSALDLKAHQVEVHSTEMSSRDKKSTQRVEAEFEFSNVGMHRARREREPPPTTQSGAAARRREAFGAHLTANGPASNGTQTPQSFGPSQRESLSLQHNGEDIDQRHTTFIARLQSVVPNSSTAVLAAEAAVRGYRFNETTARDLISTIWNILDRKLDDTAGIINAVVDLFDEEEKKSGLLASWNGFKIEQRQEFPDLVMGSGYANIASGRILNAKHATATTSSFQSSRQVWDRVAQAAGSSSPHSGSTPAPTPRPPDNFPILAGPSQPAHRQKQRVTPWASGPSTPAFRPLAPSPAPAIKKSTVAKNGPPPPSLTSAAFPELPTSRNTRAKPPVGGNQSLRNILGETPPAAAWKSNSTGSGSGAQTPDEPSIVLREAEEAGGKGKRGKGKGKQTLFTLGSFPS